MKKTETVAKESPVVTLVLLVRRHTNEARGRSRVAFDQTMAAAVSLAIQAGMRFEREDFRALANLGAVGGPDVESHYRHAAAPQRRSFTGGEGSDNSTACVAIEAYLERPPYIYDGRRLFVGSRIPWHAEGRLFAPEESTRDVSYEDGYVEVTSIADEHVIACKYAPEKYVKCKACGLSRRDYDNEPHPRRPLKRIKITLDALRARERARVKALKDALAARKAAELEESHERGYHSYNKHEGCPKCA